MDNGTIRYSASPFHAYRANYTPSITARIDCYCVTVYSDCTCHTTHADGGCDHPNVFTSCGCSGDGYSDPEPSPTTPATKSSWTGGSGGGTSYGNTGEGIYIALQKMFKPDYQFSALEKYTIINNYQYSKALIDFLNNEGFTPANKAFTLQMLYNIEDGQFTIVKQLNNSIQNFIYSQKSPVNVDLSAILNDLNLPENQKFNTVYKTLTESPEFKNLFLNIFQNSTRYNVKFQTGNIAGGANGDTKTNLLDPTNNIITIDANFIKNNSKLVVAKTILHECIHAFLNVKLCDGQLGNIPNINNEDFYNIVNKSYDGFNNDQAQHNFIYNYMIPTMEKVLAEIKDKLISPAESTFLQELVFHPESPTIDVKFNWNDFYKNLVLGGLQDCEFFKNEIATFIKDPQTGEIKSINVIDQVKLNYYNQYKTRIDGLSKN
ncbi:hypothetical protein BB050_02261 [Flavobacterium anhuiense]|uniref:SprT-like domain-containing protein n=2 Tax=Flavobacterium anhuiense TaxID=459526 RepID=A0AAC9D0I4_9FLAO|nr:hypothetical protein BB050_02261 [Flavobacterium anhuiense]